MLTPRGMSPLETASGVALGSDPGGDPGPSTGALSPAAVLESAIVAALRRPPCLVTFSGGRDSSVVLAAATAAAQREGLPAPVPVTLRFPLAADSDESSWQERVMAHLGLDEWVRIELTGELDFVGPVARDLLRGHGLLYPPNAHLVAPMLEHAAGGSLVGGLGGDELFGLWSRRRLADVAARRARSSWRDSARVLGALAPRPVRAMALRRRQSGAPLPWLRAQAQTELDAAHLDEQVRAPLRWDRHVAMTSRHRSVVLAVRDITRVTSGRDVRFHAPLLDRGFRAALARAGGWRGWGGRSATLQALFADRLPRDVLERRDKATFNGVFFTDETRRFAAEWSGDGLDESVVDTERLRETWLTPLADYRSALALQSAWLHGANGRAR